MLNKKLERALNDQINAEFYSSYLYLAMGAHFEAAGLPGCARWMQAQTQEEWFHGMKMYRFVLERGGRIELKGIAAPPERWVSPLAVFENVLAHEQKVTNLINGLVDLAVKERDHATTIFLQWFVSEQVEEEAAASAIIGKFRLIGKESGGLFALDNELGQRVFIPPPQEQA